MRSRKNLGIGMASVSALMALALLATVFLAYGSAITVQQEVEAFIWPDPAAWYRSVLGVLSTDDYPYFPHNHDNLNIGFSKHGEMIDRINKRGLEFRTVDPFAPPAGPGIGSIPEHLWFQGWLINITYNHITLGRRNVWATAQHSDILGLGGPWLRVDFPAGDCAGTAADGDSPGIKPNCEDPLDKGHAINDEHYSLPYAPLRVGGRKTNGTVIAQPIRVLYEDNRRFVAQLNISVYDHPTPGPSTEEDIHLVDIVFTIDFYKDKHQVIVLKDVKSKISDKELTGKMNIQFSNRGQWDLGNEAVGYRSFAHFYTTGRCGRDDTITEGQPTEYNEDYHLLTAHDPSDVNPIYLPEKTCFNRYAERTFTGSPSGWSTYDLFQAINPAAGVVGYAAFWPPLSDWTVYGWDIPGVQRGIPFRSMDAGDPHFIDIPNPPGEPEIPYVVGEWDFDLDDRLSTDNAFRGVTVYGVTELVEADDANRPGGSNVIEDEVGNFMLREVFQPWDLNDAALKATFRWAALRNTGAGSINLTQVIVDTVPEPNWRTPHIVPDAEWDDYSVFAERIFDFTANRALKRVVDYNVTVTSRPAPNLPLVIISDLPPNHNIKILFSTLGEPFGRYEWIAVGRDSSAVDSAGAAMVAAALKNKDCMTVVGEEEEQEEEPELPRSERPRVQQLEGPTFICIPIEVGLSGLDMRDPDRPTVAWVMRRWGPGTDRRDHYFNPGAGDYRSSFINHWPNNIVWPVKTSNIIAVGGPGANLVADYFNSFSQAIFRSSSGQYWFIGGPPFDWLIPSDWGANRVHPYPIRALGQGLAIITTYKDLDGTVGLVVYGATGEDTWWAAHWLYDIHGADVCFTYTQTLTGDTVEVCADNGLRLLQRMNLGVTTIVLRIDYRRAVFTPTIQVIHLIGTISTKNPLDP
jgi:hypothetical protein